MFNKPETILITGGAGYLGSVLSAQLLEQGYSVIILDKILWGEESLTKLQKFKNWELIRADIVALDKNLLKKCSTVIHLAAIVGEPMAREDFAWTTLVNLEATRMLYRYAVETGIRTFIFASTCSNYGVLEPPEKADENTALKPLGIYARTKVDAERFLLAQNDPVNTVICRLSTLFGLSYRPRFDLTINHFTRDAYYKKELLVYDADTIRPYIHVADAARAIGALALWAEARSNLRTVINIGDDRFNLTKIEIAGLIQKYLPETRIDFLDQSVDRRHYAVRFSRLAETLPDFRVTQTPEEGIVQFIDIFKNNLIANPFDKKYVNC